MLQVATMIMESFKGFEHKYKVRLRGHSGDGPNIKLVDYGELPTHRGQRLQLIERMHAHTQFCMSGDFTLEATELAVDEAAEHPDADDRFVFVLSDANFRRYRIRSADFKHALTRQPEVKAYAIFIANPREAEVLQESLPHGRAYSCQDTSKLPLTFKHIFETSVIS